MTGVGLLSGSQGSCGGGEHSLSVQVEKIHLNCVCICLGVCVYDSLCFQTPYCGFTLLPPSVFVCHLSLISLPYLFCDKPRFLEQGQALVHTALSGVLHTACFPLGTGMRCCRSTACCRRFVIFLPLYYVGIADKCNKCL